MLISLARSLTRLACSLALVSLAVAGSPLNAPASDADVLSIGSKAPDLNIEHWLQDGQGKYPHVTKLEPGKVYVVEFWATWCPPCIRSMPHLSELQEKYADKGVQIISISDEDLDTVTQFLQRDASQIVGRPATFQEVTAGYSLTTDPDRSSHQAYFEAAGQTGIPSAFLVGKDGYIEWIGHPMEMDEPLEKVVAGTWDREAYAAQFKARQELEMAQQQVMQLASSGDFQGAIDKIDSVTQAIDDPGLKSAMLGMKLQLMIVGNQPEANIVGTFNSIVSDVDDAMFTNQLSWMVSELKKAGRLTGDALVAAALKAVETAAETVQGNDRANVLDTVAHLRDLSGDLAGAIAAQEEAVSLCSDELAEQLKAYLEELKRRSNP
jgi:thiol-disulfide isomerase/thioredoxin